MTRDRVRPAALARQVLLPSLIGGAGIACLLLVLAVGGVRWAKATNVLAGGGGAELTQRVSGDLEGTPTSARVRRGRRPLSERRRLLAAHPYVELYKIAERRFGVSWFLVASIHYQETGFGKALRGRRSARPGGATVTPHAASLVPGAGLRTRRCATTSTS